MVSSTFLQRHRAILGTAIACGIVASNGPPPSVAQGSKTYVMKLSTATINDPQHEWLRRFGALVEKDSGGGIKGEIYAASQLGSIPRQIEGVQFCSIQGWMGPPEFLVGIDERLGEQRRLWIERGGELFSLPPAEQAAMMEKISSIGDDLSKAKPELNKAVKVVLESAMRNK